MGAGILMAVVTGVMVLGMLVGGYVTGRWWRAAWASMLLIAFAVVVSRFRLGDAFRSILPIVPAFLIMPILYHQRRRRNGTEGNVSS